MVLNPPPPVEPKETLMAWNCLFPCFFTRYEPEKEKELFLSVVTAEVAAEKECLKYCYTLVVDKGFFQKEIRHKSTPFFFFGGESGDSWFCLFVIFSLFVLFNYPDFGAVEGPVHREEKEEEHQPLAQFGGEAVG